MALVSGTVPNLLGGMSQQPDILRHPNQLQSQRNMVTSLVDGLIKRPPLEHYAFLGNDKITNPNAHFHWIDRDPTERYLLILRDNAAPQVYDLVNKTFKTVSTPDGVGYLNVSGAPRDVFRCVTVADYTFIVNTEKVVATSSDKTGWSAKEITDVIVKQGHYSTQYVVKAQDTGAIGSYTTPASTDAGAEAAIATDKIAQELADAINAGTGSHGFSANNSGSGVRITHPAGQGVDVKGVDAYDGLGGNGMTILHRSVQSFTDLPTWGHRGKLIEITGDPGTDFDNYWVISDGPTSGWTTLTWDERPAPEIEYKLDPTTMPHILVREADGTFTFKQATWAERTCGDLETNPWPTFVGKTIKDVFFFKNRLGFLSGESACLSKVGEYFQFLRTTAVTLLDDDPIDVSVSTNQVANLQYAALSGGRLFAFSNKLQFELIGDPLTPNTAALVNIARYDMKSVPPMVGGNSVFFAFDRGTEYSGIWEFIPATSVDEDTFEDITSHVPKLLGGGIAAMAYSTVEQTLFVLPQTMDRKTVYVYKAHWEDRVEGRERVVAAWSFWTFPSDLLSLRIYDEYLYAVVFDDPSNHLNVARMDLRSGVMEGVGWDWKMLLDFRVHISDLSPSYSAPNTTVTLPYRNWNNTSTPVQVFDLDTLAEITPVSVDPATGQVVLEGDQTSANLLIGMQYTALVEFTRPVPRRGSNGHQVPLADGDLYILFWSINYANSGRIRCRVRLPDGSQRAYTEVGSATGKTGTLKSGLFKFPVRAKAGEKLTIDVINDKPYPSQLVNAGWEGNFIMRSRLI